jgi:ABC-2 type transport system permease protein
VIRRAIVLSFLGHELRDLRTNARVVPLFFIFPILGIVFPVAIALLGPTMVTEAARDPGMMAVLRAATNVIEFQGLDMSEAMTRYMLRAVVAFYLLMPIAVASTAAAFSIVGEKQQRTLEPILATPITDREFLAGKLMVCLVPTVAVTWLTGVVAVALVDAITYVRAREVLLPDRFWVAGIGLLAPLLGIAVTLVTMRLSARSVDPQATVQASALAIIPGFLVIFGVFGRILVASFPALLVGIGIMIAIDLWLFRRVEKTFEREEILTRWR